MFTFTQLALEKLLTLKKFKANMRTNKNIQNHPIARDKSDLKVHFSQEDPQGENLSLPYKFLRTASKSKKILRLLSQRVTNLNHLKVNRRCPIKSLEKTKMQKLQRN